MSNEFYQERVVHMIQAFKTHFEVTFTWASLSFDNSKYTVLSSLILSEKATVQKQ